MRKYFWFPREEVKEKVVLSRFVDWKVRISPVRPAFGEYGGRVEEGVVEVIETRCLSSKIDIVEDVLQAVAAFAFQDLLLSYLFGKVRALCQR